LDRIDPQMLFEDETLFEDWAEEATQPNHTIPCTKPS
jgi:hypothetical protein